jgi:hypothetical protein
MICEEDDDRVDIVESIHGEITLEPESSDHLGDARVRDILSEWTTVVEDILTSLIRDRRGKSGRLTRGDSLEFFLYFCINSEFTVIDSQFLCY